MEDFDKVKQQLDENSVARQRLLSEMLSFYSPAGKGETAELELTSVDLADQFSDTVEVSPDALAVMLAKAGFHVKLQGSKFLWQLNVNK